MQESVYDIVITYKILSSEQVSSIIRNVLETSKKISSRNIDKIIMTVEQPTQNQLKKAAQEKEQEEQKKQQRKEEQEKLIAEQQKIKDEQERIEAEKEQHLAHIEAENQKQAFNITQYKSEKDGWYDILYNIASNKQATQQSNHDHTQQALQKSQSLLQLADAIPTKNKTSLSQKLKQKFSIALLEQQKRNNHDLNIYHHMDIFNNAINEMVE